MIERLRNWWIGTGRQRRDPMYRYWPWHPSGHLGLMLCESIACAIRDQRWVQVSLPYQSGRNSCPLCELRPHVREILHKSN